MLFRGSTARAARATRAWYAVALGLLVAGGAFLRLWDLGSSQLTYDETFTAMAGRMPVHAMFAYLRQHDSHPPLDYLLRSPLARAGVSDFFLRLPSAVFSIAALALLAWWLHDRRRIALLAVALFAFDAFEVVHGRDARMYAEMELIGVASAVITDSWLRRPRGWHAPAIAVIALAGLLTHVSMILVAVGLLAVAGLRTDAPAWRWRAALLVAGAGWGVLWGQSFLAQTHGDHSTWIGRTTVPSFSIAMARLVSSEPFLWPVVLLATIVGGAVIVRRDATLGRLWLACFALPAALGALAGLVAPVVLDRTFTVVAWGPVLAISYACDGLLRARRPVVVSRVAAATIPTALLVTGITSSAHAATARTRQDAPLRRLERVARPGDVLVVRPAITGIEVEWAVVVREHFAAHTVPVVGMPNADAVRLEGTPTGRAWVLTWNPHTAPRGPTCAPTWRHGNLRITCVRVPFARGAAPVSVT